MYLARDPRCATGTTVALGYASGQRHFLSCLPNNQTLGFEDLDLSALEGCRHLLRADVWFSQAMLEGGNRRLLLAAHSCGLATSLDINFDPQWSTGSKEAVASRKQQLREVLDLVDLAHGNTSELCEFTDSPNLDTALRRLTDWGVKAVVTHLGSQGAGYWKNGQLVVEPPDSAVNPVNSTGTGDVLSVCMISWKPPRNSPSHRNSAWPIASCAILWRGGGSSFRACSGPFLMKPGFGYASYDRAS